jgi:hypothetical protein
MSVSLRPKQLQRPWNQIEWPLLAELMRLEMPWRKTPSPRDYWWFLTTSLTTVYTCSLRTSFLRKASNSGTTNVEDSCVWRTVLTLAWLWLCLPNGCS